MSRASCIARFAVIGVVVARIAGLFAYAGGWLTPPDRQQIEVGTLTVGRVESEDTSPAPLRDVSGPSQWVLFHTLIMRDRLLNRMAVWPISRKNILQK